MSVSTQVLAYVAAVQAGTPVNQSSAHTATINITSGFEVMFPIGVKFSNVSADAVVKVYPSADGGANFDTVASLQMAIPRTANAVVRQSMRLPAGIYAVVFINSGPNTATFQLLTQQVLTAINNA